MRSVRFLFLWWLLTIPISLVQAQQSWQSLHQWNVTERLAFISQIGLDNTASILQRGRVEDRLSMATINQQLQSNIASIEDHGKDNHITISQLGYMQNATVTTSGDGNTEVVTQIGLENVFSLLSSVHGDAGTYIQNGTDNQLSLRKRAGGSVPLEIQQVGNGMRLIIE